jgi:hypothetical protein
MWAQSRTSSSGNSEPGMAASRVSKTASSPCFISASILTLTTTSGPSSISFLRNSYSLLESEMPKVDGAPFFPQADQCRS